MRFVDMLGLARDNLSRARLRTALTATGVAIGTAAVVTLISVGNGAESFFINRAASFGQLTLAEVQPYTAATREAGRAFHALTPATVRAIARLPHVDQVYSALSLPPLRLTMGARSRDLPAAGQSPLTTTLTMVTHLVPGVAEGVLVPDTLARSWHVAPSALLGRAVTLTAGGSVCCSSAAGNSIVVLGPDRHFAARIAGVYQGTSWSSPGGLKVDASTPPLLLTTALGAQIDGRLHNMLGSAYLNRQGYDLVFVHSDDARQSAAIAHSITAMNYQVFARADLLNQVHIVFTVLTAVLGAIGGIALLVAAVGIANTMIMTILERTREIGIMKALGAEPGTVRALFLVETGLVGLLGGVIGLLLAEAASVIGNAGFRIWLRGQGVTDNVGNISSVSPELIAGAVLLAIVVSLLAGALPSRRAVRLQPLDALRFE